MNILSRRRADKIRFQVGKTNGRSIVARRGRPSGSESSASSTTISVDSSEPVGNLTCRYLTSSTCSAESSTNRPARTTPSIAALPETPSESASLRRRLITVIFTGTKNIGTSRIARLPVISGRKIAESNRSAIPGNLHRAGIAVPVFADMDLCQAFLRRIVVIDLIAVHQQDLIRLLLNIARVFHLTDPGPLVRTALHAAVYLRQGDDGNIQIARQRLQAAHNRPHLIDPAFSVSLNPLNVIQIEDVDIVLVPPVPRHPRHFVNRWRAAVIQPVPHAGQMPRRVHNFSRILLIDAALPQSMQRHPGAR